MLKDIFSGSITNSNQCEIKQTNEVVLDKLVIKYQVSYDKLVSIKEELNELVNWNKSSNQYHATIPLQSKAEYNKYADFEGSYSLWVGITFGGNSKYNLKLGFNPTKANLHEIHHLITFVLGLDFLSVINESVIARAEFAYDFVHPMNQCCFYSNKHRNIQQIESQGKSVYFGIDKYADSFIAYDKVKELESKLNGLSCSLHINAFNKKWYVKEKNKLFVESLTEELPLANYTVIRVEFRKIKGNVKFTSINSLENYFNNIEIFDLSKVNHKALENYLFSATDRKFACELYKMLSVISCNTFNSYLSLIEDKYLKVKMRNLIRKNMAFDGWKPDKLWQSQKSVSGKFIEKCYSLCN